MVGDQKSVKAILKQPIPKPEGTKETFLHFEGYWVRQGAFDPVIPEDYVLTKSVRKNLKDLVRVVSIGKLPVLLQVFYFPVLSIFLHLIMSSSRLGNIFSYLILFF